MATLHCCALLVLLSATLAQDLPPSLSPPAPPPISLQTGNTGPPEPTLLPLPNPTQEIVIVVPTEPAETGTQYSPAERAPVFSVLPRNVTVPVGGTAQFKCAASSIPGPQLVFIKEEDVYEAPDFRNKDEVRGSRNQDYVIDHITEINEGWYRCIAANAFGIVETRVYLRVLNLCDALDCKAPKTCFQDIEAETAECVCPTATCPLTSDPVCGADCKVHFNPCLWNQTSCENEYDSSEIIGRGQTCPEITSPSVTMLTEKVSLEEGQDFHLECETSGFPEPSIDWLKLDSSGEVVDIVGSGKRLTVKGAALSAAGTYVARATNCIIDSVNSRSAFVEIRPLPVPTEASGSRSVCNIFGDPHIHTFDGMTFNFAGECTYVLAMDCLSAQWIVYGGFVGCGAGTCLDSVTIYVNYKPIELQRGWVLNMNGRKNRFVEGKPFSINNIDFTFDGLILKGVIQGAGVQVTWDGYTGVQITVDDDRKHMTCGVCGNNDGLASNEAEQSMNIHRTEQSNEPNRYGDSWKVDRSGLCTLPANVEFDANEPCGVDYAKSYKAKAACQSLIENPVLKTCGDKLSLKFFYESCLYDFCYMGLLRGDGGGAGSGGGGAAVSVECYIARAYATHCSLLGHPTRGWDAYMTCPKESYQDALLTISCPQEIAPFLRY